MKHITTNSNLHTIYIEKQNRVTLWLLEPISDVGRGMTVCVCVCVSLSLSLCVCMCVCVCVTGIDKLKFISF